MALRQSTKIAKLRDNGKYLGEVESTEAHASVQQIPDIRKTSCSSIPYIPPAGEEVQEPQIQLHSLFESTSIPNSFSLLDSPLITRYWLVALGCMVDL